jgi:predicted NBD/HSP70 family sugar kinase
MTFACQGLVRVSFSYQTGASIATRLGLGFVWLPNEVAMSSVRIESHPAARPLDVRRHNLALVLQQVASRDRVSRAEIARRTGLTKGTVSILVQELLNTGLLIELGPQSSGQIGRPSTALSLNGDRLCGVGLDIGVDYLAVCVTDLLHRVRYERIETADNRDAGPDHILDRAERLITTAVEAARSDGLAATGACVALPGMLNGDGGRLLVAPNLGWSDLRIIDELTSRLGPSGLPIHADNEANLAALAELWLGEGARDGDYVYVSGEVGIGAGIVVGGRLFRGSHGFAGEIGHIVVDPNGSACSCGGRGCLERVAGQEAILATAGLSTTAATSIGHNESPLPGLLGLLERRDAAATTALADAGTALGIALADIINVIDVDTIVLGGIYAPFTPWLIAPLERELNRQVMGARERAVKLRPSALGPDAAVRGAAACIVQQILAGPGSAVTA